MSEKVEGIPSKSDAHPAPLPTMGTGTGTGTGTQQGRRSSGSYSQRKSDYIHSDAITGVKDLPSCEFRKSVRLSARLKEGDVDAIAAATTAATTTTNKNNGGTSCVSTTFTFLTKGGTVFDGFLLAASQEVGQVILTLPWVFSLVGMTSGVVLQIVFATTALYTNYLLVNLHTEFRKRLAEDKTDPRSVDPHYIVSYHDIMGGLIAPWAKWFSFFIVFLALFGLTTVQIIATGSNMFLFYDGLPKRTWSLISGGVFSLVAFIPNFRHYRMMVILANIATTYTSWYMTVAAAVEGPLPDVVYDAPTNYDNWFRGMVGLLFCFGGHASNIEVADVMDDHSTYDTSYFYAFLYVFTLTMPNAVTAYHTYGNVAREHNNAFGLYPQSSARDVGLILMCINNLVAFGLFIGPLFHIWERALKIDNKAFWIRAFVRLPLCGIILLFAVAFPFFGPINSILGALTTSFATYIIPLVAFNIVYQTNDDTMNMAKPLPAWAKLNAVRYINYLAATILLVCGVGIGGYTSIKNFIAQIEKFEYFACCYQCPDNWNSTKC